jgi:hypothetical protein
VRLKGGCPAVFSRVSSEAAALTTAGCPWELVPGVSSALAAPLLAGKQGRALAGGCGRALAGEQGSAQARVLPLYSAVTASRQQSRKVVGNRLAHTPCGAAHAGLDGINVPGGCAPAHVSACWVLAYC